MEKLSGEVYWYSMKVMYILITSAVVLGAGFLLFKQKTSDDITTNTTGDITKTTMTNTIQLDIEDEMVGTGDVATAGKSVTVHYVGSLTNGTVFDASRKRGDQVFTFVLGTGQVIKGWDEGVAGMKVGGKRKLTIPPELAYGSQAVGGVIPANSTLIFEVELLKVVN